jgi:transcription antitermination factor NusG
MTPEFVWLVVYIDSSYITKIPTDLRKDKRFKEVEFCVPMVKVLKKKFKGKMEYSQIPMLFNYGFVKIPKDQSNYVEYLRDLKETVNALISYVKDPCKAMKHSQIKTNPDIKTKTLPFAIAEEEEIAKLLDHQDRISLHSAEDLGKLSPGGFVTLIGYPFDGMDAEIVSVNYSKREAEVKLLSASVLQRAKVSFENLFYSVYSSEVEEPSKVKSLEELGPKAMQFIYNIKVDLDGTID